MIFNGIKHDRKSLHPKKVEPRQTIIWHFLCMYINLATWANLVFYFFIELSTTETLKKSLKYMYCEHSKLGIGGIWNRRSYLTWLTRTAKFDLLIEIVCYKWHHITLLNNHTSQSIIMCNNSIITITRKVQTYKPWNPLVLASYNSYRFTHNISRSDTDKTFTRGCHLTIIVTN